MKRLVAKKAVLFRSVLIVSVLALSLLLAPTAGIAKRDRSETQSYIGGGDAAFICKDSLGTPASVGGVCFNLDGRESVAFIDINDGSGQPVVGLYQFTDSSGSDQGGTFFCDSTVLQVPNNAHRLNIFLSNVLGVANEAIAGTNCLDQGSAGSATAGDVTVSYELKGGPNRNVFDEERECLEPVPDSAGIAGVTDAGQTVNLAVSVLLDGVSPDKGTAVFSKAAESYAPLGIDMVATFESVSFTGNEAQGLILQAKERFRGVRPSGTDIVYVLTSKDITALGTSGVAGLADCIGGVRFPERAFAVGEVPSFENLEAGPITFYLDATARIAAHEIGHLMGGHHHYANCAEGITASDVSDGEPHTICTLMSNFVDFVSGNFSVVNDPVVRGHAVNYASP